MITCKVDTSGLSKLYRELSLRTGRPMGEVLRDEARLMAIELVKSTPPKTKAQGEGAILGDLNRIFELRNGTYLKWLGDNFGIQGPDGIEIQHQALFTKAKVAYVIDKAVISPDGRGMAQWHENHMLRGRKRTVGYGSEGHQDKTIGRWKNREKMWVSFEAFKDYYDKIKKRVGFMKSGWVKAYYDLGGGSKGKGEKVAWWIESHYDNGNPRGYADTTNLFNPGAFRERFAEVTNYTDGIIQNIGNAVRFAVKKRTAGLKTRLKRIIETGKDYEH